MLLSGRALIGSKLPQLSFLSFVRFNGSGSTSELYQRETRIGLWGRQGSHMGYPRTTPTAGGRSQRRPLPHREPGADLTLQERLDELYGSETERLAERTDIGLSAEVRSALLLSAYPESLKDKPVAGTEWKKQQRENPELERAARMRTLKVSLDDVRSTYVHSGRLFSDIRSCADLYGIYEDLFGKEYVWTPAVDLKVEFDYDEEMVTPVHRGNIIKPSESSTVPSVSFFSEPDSLYTLILSNPDGHFTEENAEYVHWMVGNIKGGDLSTGTLLADYLQPFPPKGTGFHRMVFVLYKQSGPLDLSSYQRPPNCTNLSSRTFRTSEFYSQHQADLSPAGLAFFQTDWDSSLTQFYHDKLEMKEPRYEYHFNTHYVRPWQRLYPHHFKQGFNLFLDRYREPKNIQTELVRKQLAVHHPFKGNTEAQIKYPNAHEIDMKLPQWRRREIERERIRRGLYRDLDWKELRRDPSLA